MFRNLLQDVRYGLRTLRSSPGFTAVAVLALALGIGANTAIFSVVNAVLLRPLPYRDADRLVTIWAVNQARNVPFAFTSYENFSDWKAEARSFERMSAYSPASMNLVAGGEPERIAAWRVNAAFFDLAGVPPAIGRSFTAEEDSPGAGRTIVLSYELWRRRFGSDKGLIGRTILLNGEAYTVLGVMPRGFYFSNRQVDAWTPIARSANRGGRDYFSVGAFAKLKPGVSVAQAQAEMDGISRRLAAQYPANRNWTTRVWGIREWAVRDVRLSLIVLLAAVALVLLIACANVSNLLLVRAGARSREIAVRLALGAGRWRLVRQLLTESALLGIAGGAAGLLLAYWGIGLLSMLGTDRYPMLQETRVDLSVLGFTLAASLLTALLFGVAPALAATRGDVHESLKEGGRSASESIRRNRVRSALVVSEVALALLLMIGATLVLRSFARLQEVNPGFDPSGVLTASITLPPARYAQPQQQAAFFEQLLDRLEALPAVKAAGIVNVLPLSGNNTGEGLLVEGHPVSGPADVPILYTRSVTPNFFRAMGIALRSGRFFTRADGPGAQKVIIVNETLARRFWPNENPIGKRIGTGREEDWMSVVGVVADVRHTSLAREAEAEMFRPFAQAPRAGMTLTVRTTAAPLLFAPDLRRTVQAIDSELPVSKVGSLEQAVAESIAPRRFAAVLLAIFAGVALVLAAVGIYGVISFSVARRTHDIGVRMALGASAGDVLRLVIAQGMALTLAGLAVGLGASLWLTRLLGAMLYAVPATDLATFAGVPAALALVAFAASYVPARRATRLHPVNALRYE